ncbi:hypothetical protein GCM10027565_45820 [Bordetella tumulicola]
MFNCVIGAMMDSTRKGKVGMRHGKIAVEARIVAIIGNRGARAWSS